MSTQPAFTWTSSSRSDVGMVRQVNEDACIARPEAGLWAVADGMGGHAAGDVASGMIAQALAEVQPRERLSEVVDEVESRLLEVNSRLKEIAAERDAKTIGSTVASLVAAGRHCVCMWAGDSRVYRYRNGTIEKMTQDHALVEDLVQKGMLTREEAQHHPQGNLVTRAVGAAAQLFVDVEIYELGDGDVFVLCSDGLDKEVSESEIAATIAGHTQGSLSDALVELALSRGARDNVTVVSIHVSENDVEEKTIPPARPDSAAADEEDTAPGRNPRG